ncbi:hypothetical protein [Streptomyces himastatinicus]|uniref:hypothetical protein n=1 Tax=Streptomyces himastatinicus TaxID=998084 RepID=UPI003CCB6B56
MSEDEALDGLVASNGYSTSSLDALADPETGTTRVTTYADRTATALAPPIDDPDTSDVCWVVGYPQDGRLIRNGRRGRARRTVAGAGPLRAHEVSGAGWSVVVVAVVVVVVDVLAQDLGVWGASTVMSWLLWSLPKNVDLPDQGAVAVGVSSSAEVAVPGTAFRAAAVAWS